MIFSPLLRPDIYTTIVGGSVICGDGENWLMDVDDVLFNLPGGHEASELPIIFSFFQMMCHNW